MAAKIQKRFVIALTAEEFESLTVKAKARNARMTAIVGQALVGLASMGAQVDVGALPPQTLIRPSYRGGNLKLKEGVADPVELVKNSVTPEEIAEAQAASILTAYDEESCFLPPGEMFLSALLVFAAFEPGFSRERSALGIAVNLYAQDETVPQIMRRLAVRSVDNDYVRTRMEKLLRKKTFELTEIGMFVREGLSLLFESMPEHNDVEPPPAMSHIIVDLSEENYRALMAMAARLDVSIGTLGRMAIARLVHMRPHLALVPSSAKPMDKKAT